jgi:hypothetical protein
MSTEVSHDVLTLLDSAKRVDPHGNPAKIAEVLDRADTLMSTALWMPANSPTQHDFSIRLSEPAGSWTAINEGVTKEASKVKQDVAYMGTLESMSAIDIRLLRKYKPSIRNHIRSTEDLAFVKGMSKTFSTAFIYGNRLTNPKSFTGLHPRADYNSTSDDNVIDAGDSGTVYSAWLVQWGADAVHFVYPVGDNGKFDGIKDDDMGKQLIYDSDDKPYRAMCTFFSISGGLVIHDPRCVQRITNLDNVTGGNGVWDEDYLIEAINNIPGEGDSSILYIPKFLRKNIWISIKDATNVQYGLDGAFGTKRLWTSLLGTRIGLCYGCETTHTALS